MPSQSTNLLGGVNPEHYIQQYLGSSLDHIIHLSNNLPLLINISNNLVAIDTLDDYANAIQIVANHITNNSNIIQGATGATGLTGATGATGLTGAIGSHGSIGNTGATGNAGVMGQTGNAGATGNVGATGTNGVTPHIDPTTKNWYLGTTDLGVLAQGTDGINGATGQDGVGVVWQPALDYTNDLPSLPYENETDAFFINDTGMAWRYQASINGWINIGNRKGLTGNTGANGADGADGIDGTNGVGSAGSTGSQGTAGTDGTNGLSSYELWVALDPSNNTLSLVDWIDSQSGGVYGSALSSVNLLAGLTAVNTEHRDIVSGGLNRTFVFHTGTTNTVGDIVSTVVGLTGYWRDETVGTFYDSSLFAIKSKGSSVVGLNSCGIGFSSIASKTNSVALGNGSTSSSTNGLAVGAGSEVTHSTGGLGGVAVGTDAIARQGTNVSIGTNVVTNKEDSISIGANIVNDSTDVTCIATTSIEVVTDSSGYSSVYSNNSNTNNSIELLDSVFMGSYPPVLLDHSVVIGGQNSSIDKTQVHVTSLGFNSMPTVTRQACTTLGRNSADFITDNSQAVITTGAGLVLKGRANASSPTSDFIQFAVPIKDSSNTLGDTTKMLSATTSGHTKWVNIPSSQLAPTWVSLIGSVSGGIGLINASNPPEYKKVGDTVTITGAFLETLSNGVATNLMVSVPASIRPDETVVGSAIDTTQLNLTPMLVLITTGGLVQVQFNGKQIVTWDGTNVTDVVDEAVPTRVEFSITYRV
jgi:hypothetical protein